MSVFKESTSYRPFKYPWAVTAAREHSIDMYWDVHQVELQDDLRQYNSKDGLATKDISHKDNKFIIDSTLCLFTEMDRVVGEGYTKILPRIKNNEIRNLLMTFAQREVVHQRAYALGAETFGFEDSAWTSLAEYKEMVEKLDVMSRKWYPDNLRMELETAIDLAQILLGEGMGLYTAFANLLNFKRFGVIVGFNDINQWSLIDEQAHVINNIKILNEIRKDLTEIENQELDRFIVKIADAYVQAEYKYIDLVYQYSDQQDMTKEDLKEYITYLKEFREYQLGLRGFTEVRKNPLPWMEWLLSGEKHDNFFEKKVTDYVHGGLKGRVNYDKYSKVV